MSSRSGSGCRLRQNCQFFPPRQNFRFLAKTLAISLQPGIHIKLNEASQVLRSQQRGGGGCGSWNCFVLCSSKCDSGQPDTRTVDTPSLQERNTDRSIVCLTRDQRIEAARKARSSSFRFHRILQRIRMRGRRCCFRGECGADCRGAGQARYPPPSLPLTMERAGVTWQPVPEIWGRHHRRYFLAWLLTCELLTCPTTFATLLKSPSLPTFWLSPFYLSPGR